MDVFDVRDQLIDDYRSFTTSFVDIADPRIKDYVNNEVDRGKQWPEPWLSLNPMFASGGRVDELVGMGLLHGECERIFRALVACAVRLTLEGFVVRFGRRPRIGEAERQLAEDRLMYFSELD